MDETTFRKWKKLGYYEQSELASVVALKPKEKEKVLELIRTNGKGVKK